MDNLINIYNSKEIINKYKVTSQKENRVRQEIWLMAQQLRALAVLAEAPVQVPALTQQIKAICNSSSRGSSAPLWPLWAPAFTWCTPIKIKEIFVKAPRRSRERLGEYFAFSHYHYEDRKWEGTLEHHPCTEN